MNGPILPQGLSRLDTLKYCRLEVSLSTVPVVRYGACVTAWRRWGEPGVAVCGVVTVPAVVPGISG